MEYKKKIILNIATLFIVYSILFSEQGMIGNIFNNKMTIKTEDKAEKNINLEGSFIEKSLSRIFINALQTPQGYELISKYIHSPLKNLEDNNLVIKLSDQLNFAKLNHLKEISLGAGGEAICGSRVKIKYIINEKNNKLAKDNIEIVLGEGGENLLIENACISMKKGGQRQISYAKNNNYIIDLLDIKDNFVGADIRIFDDYFNLNASPLLCGDLVSFKVKIQKFNGENIYENNVKYKLGDRKYPIIFNYALFDKTLTGSRTVIAPGKYILSFDNNLFDSSIKIEKEEFYLIEFSDFIKH